MSKAKRKPPTMPHIYWLDVDNCWWCNNTYGCTNCKTCIKVREEHYGGSYQKQRQCEDAKQQRKELEYNEE